MALNGTLRMLCAVRRAEGVLQNLGCAEEDVTLFQIEKTGTWVS